MRVVRPLVAALAAALLPASVHAQGQVADLSRATCAQLMELRGAERSQLLIWLHGYYAGAAQRPVIDRNRFDQTGESLLRSCQGQPDTPLIGAAAREIFLGDQAGQNAPASQPSTATGGQPPQAPGTASGAPQNAASPTR